MGKDYVIDENVLLNAWHGKKPNNTDALSERKFLHDIFYGNQHLAISHKIRGKFSKIGKKLQEQQKGVDNLVIPLFLKLIFNSKRATMHTPIKTNFKGVKNCDKEFVGVALKSNGIIVTADHKLKMAISDDPSVKHIECMTTEEVIASFSK